MPIIKTEHSPNKKQANMRGNFFFIKDGDTLCNCVGDMNSREGKIELN